MTQVFLPSPDAYESAKMLCEQYYLGAPELELTQINGTTENWFYFQWVQTDR